MQSSVLSSTPMPKLFTDSSLMIAELNFQEVSADLANLNLALHHRGIVDEEIGHVHISFMQTGLLAQLEARRAWYPNGPGFNHDLSPTRAFFPRLWRFEF